MPVARRVVAALVATVCLPGVAAAVRFNACTAAQISAQDSNCPTGTGPCTISKLFDIGDGCTLDFGTRAVTVAGSGELAFASGTITIKAGNFTIAGGAHVEGRGTGSSAPTNHGGMVTIQATGNVAIQKAASAGILDVSGNAQGGTALIVAGGTFTLDGQLKSTNLTSSGAGGFISVRATGNLTTALGSTLQAIGGSLNGGGAIDLSSESGKVDLGDTVDVGGGEGGSLDVFAGTDIDVRRVNATGVGDAGSGGCLSFSAGRNLQFLALITANGTGSATGFGGGCGGFFDAEARFGNLTVTDNVQCEGAPPDGGGGDISLYAKGNVNLTTGDTLSARGTGFDGCGGEIDIEAELDATLAGGVDTSGGFGGNFVDISAGRNLTISGPVTLAARSDGGYAGEIDAEAGALGYGALSISSTIDGTGGACSDLNGCGAGGFSDLTGCDVTIGTTALLDMRGPDAGENFLTAREQLRVQGTLNANRTSPSGVLGDNQFIYPTRLPPIVTGTVTPAAVTQGLATCTATVHSSCLDPCPTCGNGVIEFPETCDTVGTPTSCDGCSLFCRIENCNDTNLCTADSCDPTLGCRHDTTNNGLPCSDNNVCNGAEHCQSGFCLSGTPLNCADTNPCTRDVCDSVLGCTHPPANTGTACSDNNQCTLGDACDGAGNCTPGSTPRVCDDFNECTTNGCNPATGCVYANRTGACTDDGNVCTNDVCAGGACTHPNRANGTTCDDGAFCTVNDACQSGNCTGSARDCADTSSCTADTCDETSDACVHTPQASCCGNGTVDPPEACDDGNTSNSDACLNTCVAATCGDGFVRTDVEACDAGASNSNAPNAACRTDCQPRRCGDGIVDDASGEQCDDGGTAAGDGCSPTCLSERPATAELIAGKGRPAYDCIIEWAMNQPQFDRGVPSFKQQCQDGDPVCDHDATSGECTFHVWLCANNHDARLPECTPGASGVGFAARIEVRKPSSRAAASRPVDAANLQQLQQSAQAVEGSAFDRCGPRMDIRVVRGSPTRKGSRTLVLRATSDRDVRDLDKLKLFCLP